MCSLIENALLNLLNLPLNYLSKHSLPNCLYFIFYSDVGGVISSFYTFNALCGVCLALKKYAELTTHSIVLPKNHGETLRL